jgi:hypothetical protein
MITSTPSINRYNVSKGWSIVLSVDWFKHDEILFVATNDSKNGLIMAFNESYYGTFFDYTNIAIEATKAANGKLLDVSETFIDGKRFKLISSMKDEVIVWAWVTVYNGSGYLFVCGGSKIEEKYLYSECFKIAESMQIR